MIRLPDACAVAFKEWSGVCQALADGRQSILLRKGGIAEDRGVFVPEHKVFWLYPTHVHEAQQGLRIEPVPPEARTPADRVALDALAVVESIDYLDRPEALGVLAEFHVWTEETVWKRFTYRQPGLWVLGVRVARRPEPWRIEVTPDHAGCKSWVPLAGPLSTEGAVPVLNDDEAARRLDRLRAVLGEGGR